MNIGLDSFSFGNISLPYFGGKGDFTYNNKPFCLTKINVSFIFYQLSMRQALETLYITDDEDFQRSF